MTGAAAVVLAAGGGRRFGAAKQVAVLDGRPLVAHAVDAAAAAGLAPIVVVVGESASEVTAALDGRRDVQIVRNAEWATGQASSLRCGIDALGPEVTVAVVLLADQPGVTVSAVHAVVDAARAGAPVARARYADGASHPVALSRAVWAAARTLEGDTGARALFGQVEVVDVAVPGAVPRDVDRPEDLARLRAADSSDPAGPPT